MWTSRAILPRVSRLSKVSQKTRRAPQAPHSPAAPVSLPPIERAAWLTWTLVVFAAAVVFSRYWFGIGDSDFWWHLKTGQFVWQNHRLPVPDPFAYTTYLHPDAYPGESMVRHFNLTHEWLSQLAFYAVYSLGGAAGIAVLRSLLITLICGFVGLVAWRRTGGFYRALAAALLTAATCTWIAGERPYLFTYALLGAVFAILEFRRFYWALPPLFLLWANLHGAFFLGWIVMGAYCLEALLARRAGNPEPGERRLLLCAGLSVLISGLNPNGFHIVQILLAYRNSPLQTSIAEWLRPKYWELSTFTAILYASLAALLWAQLFSKTRVRLADWIVFLLFAAASLTAVRNIILVGIIGPIVLASYVPAFHPAHFFPRVRLLPTLLACAALVFLAFRLVSMPHPAFETADWRVPQGAADFLLSHRLNARLFNSYESGGYLIWRLWPQNQVFIDGRALSEQTFLDYRRIAFNADSSGGPSADDLLARYNIGAILTPMIDYSGKVYLLPAALTDPSQHAWHLVYAAADAVVYLKTVPPDIVPLPPAAAFAAMEAQCNVMLDRAGDDCARGVADLYGKIGDNARAAQWMAVYRTRGGGANARYEGAR